MDAGDIYQATKDAFIDAMAEVKPQPRLMRIDEFMAEDEEGQPVRVVGVIDDPDLMRFVVIEEDEDGQIYPIARQAIFKAGTFAK